MDSNNFQEWVNRTQTETDIVTLAPVQSLAAALDSAAAYEAGSRLPALWHWLYFLPKALWSGIGSDGHPKRGGFLPPVALPRRMWAGSRLQWEDEPLLVGDAIERTSIIESVQNKTGQSGSLTFVKVRHEVRKANGALAITEWQDIVYRDAPPPNAAPAASPKPAPGNERWNQSIRPDPVLLFRFSALTFNSHRIHYDRPYAQNEEGYPGLVVHGPLLAVLMMQLANRHAPERRVRSFEFRGLSPVIDTSPFEVCGIPDSENNSAQLFIRGGKGELSTQATVTFAP